MRCPYCSNEDTSEENYCMFCGSLIQDVNCRQKFTEPCHASPEVQIEPGSIIDDRYIVEREIERDAASVVYLVKDEVLDGKQMALKILFSKFIIIRSLK